MLHGGFGTLTFFGIASRSAKNNITTQQIATKERVSVHTQTYVSGYGAYARTHTRETARTSTPTAWEDTYTCSSRYYDANGDFCGSSQSSGTDKELHTIYYDANGCRCGTSTSGLNGYFETTYYNTDGRPCGTSTGRGYDTTYYLPDGREWDTSKSDSSGNTTYATPRQIAEREERERAEREAIAERERIAARERRERSEREAREKAERERIKANEAFQRAKQERENPIPSGAIREQVRLLSHQDLATRTRAQSALLTMAEPYCDSRGCLVQRSGFLEQITCEALSASTIITNIMVEAMTEVITNTRNGRGVTGGQQTFILDALRLYLELLPFEKKEVREIALEKKVLHVLAKMSIIYAKTQHRLGKKIHDMVNELTSTIQEIARINDKINGDYKVRNKDVWTSRQDADNTNVSPELKSYYFAVSHLTQKVSSGWCTHQTRFFKTLIHIEYQSNTPYSYTIDNPSKELIDCSIREIGEINKIYNEATMESSTEVSEFIPQLKIYYLSQASIFNASKKIFEVEGYDSIVSTMQDRATKNPKGASAKTLQHFSL